MDIEKEREEFEKEAFKQSGGWATFHKAYGDVYENNQLNFGWKVWLAAKLNAVPEGFVLVPREPTQDMMIAALAVISTGIGKDHIDVEIIQCWKKMIEAQEQSHD
ncbi:hypothetical protein [Acinetobacter bereziniae]|uniref:hypothetical protein n=1 Tax=Acinetobacter bereziniae TaxID=106648 RepID=UPI002954E6FC|nr:hypothetical protein [Acinetobacter bereziniae]MDV8155238.1 hypothetical protein [Acinetobacter bereziniae]